MQITLFGKQRPVWQAVLAVVALTTLLYANFLLYYNRETTLLAAIAMGVLFTRGDLKRLWNLPSVLLLSYVAYTALSACWAVAGKFALNQFVKLFPAALVFVALVLRGRVEKTFVRRVMAVITDVSAILALMSVEAASTGLVRSIVLGPLNVGGIDMTFNSSRLYGVFGNSNVEASVFAIGVFFSLPLLLEAKSRRERILRAAVLAFNAFAFLLVFSMGAIVCFAAAVIVYLIAAGRERGRVLSLMLSAAVPTVVLAFASARFFNASGALKLLPLLLMLLDAAAVAALDARAAERLGKLLTAHEKALYGSLLAVAALLVLYIALALRLSAPYTFGGLLFRSTPLEPGAHTIQIEADGPVTTSVFSVNSVQALAGGHDILYSGDTADAAFTVPADSRELRFYFSADEGVTLRSAVIDGKTPLMLRYRLLPSFIANRLQGTLTTNSSVLLRVMLWRDGLRYWRLNPVLGNGMGSFESGISRVQDFDYETKFPHNHYVQVLLEGGVIGFALFLSAHIALGAALWKRRRALREGDFAALSAAFAAEFVMNALQMIWDISMTNIIFLCQIFAFYALLVLLCAEPFGQKKQAAQSPEVVGAAKGGKGRKPAARRDMRSEVRAVYMLLPVFVGVTFLGNIFSQHLRNDYPETLEQYLANLELAAKIDLYEHNDAYVTYFSQVATYHVDAYLEQANEYAERLSGHPSNSSMLYLLEYYANTQQFSRAIDMALQSTIYSASDTDMWNQIADLLKQCFVDTGIYSPLLNDDGELLGKLLDYRAAWEARNAVSLSPVTLNGNNQRFFEELLELEACGGDADQKYSVLASYQPVPENVNFISSEDGE